VPDEYIPSCEATTIPLMQDHAQQDPFATLIKTKSTKGGTTAVLYIPTFSDYFWQRSIADTFADDGYHFYALEPRRYGRSLKHDNSTSRFEVFPQFSFFFLCKG
jgi:alpha-beta hydrolase superfamily lysophospholipase